MSLAKTFEELRIWQSARNFVKETYFLCSVGKGSHDFSFQDQLRRAVLSIMNNIAEGFERGTRNEFARFLDMAKGSCGEVRSMLYAAEDLGYLDGSKGQAFRDRAYDLSRGISALAKSLRKPS